MKKTVLLLLLIIVLLGNVLQAQVLLNLDPASSCNYDGSPGEDVAVYGFDSSREAEETVQNIIRQVGLPQNFIIKAANVPNAQAHVSRGERYVLYSQQFMDAIFNRTGDYWSKIAILAHEIGHHLSGHTLKEGGSRPTLELEADKFSGFVLYKMGASLQQASSAVTALAGERGSATHPPRSARLEAIAVGYNEARELSGGTQPEPERSRTTERQPDLSDDVTRTSEKEQPPKDNMVVYDGEYYPTKSFAGKTWLTKNLNVNVPDSWCYENDPKNCTTFGRLYTFEAAKQACANLGEGWRLPTIEEWKELATSYGDYLTSIGSNKEKRNSKKAYKALIKGGTSGFDAVLGGSCYYNGGYQFERLDHIGEYWSETIKENKNDQYYKDTYYVQFSSYNTGVRIRSGRIFGGLACRCVKD